MVGSLTEATTNNHKVDLTQVDQRALLLVPGIIVVRMELEETNLLRTEIGHVSSAERHFKIKMNSFNTKSSIMDGKVADLIQTLQMVLAMELAHLKIQRISKMVKRKVTCTSLA